MHLIKSLQTTTEPPNNRPNNEHFVVKHSPKVSYHWATFSNAQFLSTEFESLHGIIETKCIFAIAFLANARATHASQTSGSSHCFCVNNSNSNWHWNYICSHAFSMETMSNDTEKKRMVFDLKRVIYAKHVPLNKIIIVADDDIILV